MEELSLTKLNLFNEINNNIQLKDLIPGQKGLNITVILLELKKVLKLKNDQQIYQYLIADNTASVLCNFFDEVGRGLEIGDIIYISNAYSSLHKREMSLYSPRLNHGTIIKLDEFFYTFKEYPNMSDLLWDKVGDQYVLDQKITIKM